MITRDFDLWITQGHTKRLVFNANQYDQGETWRFRILGADGNPIVPTTAAIIGQKKDGHAILVQGTVSDGKVVITETEQMTACAGLTEFELLLNGETHGTANFTVQVEKRPGDDADLSDSDLSLIQDAVDAAEVIVEVIGDGDPSEVIGEHVDAWLDNHPEATTTVEDGAITAPKINQSLWDKLLVSEEATGNPASFDDGADDVPVSSLKVVLEPIQTGSGDPSPSNIRPIIASNGMNLANFVDNKNVGTSGAVENYAGRIATVDAIPIDSQTSYKVLFDNTDVKLCIYAVWNGSTLVRRVTSVATNTVLNTSDGTSLYVCIYSGNTPVTVESAHAMVVDSAITDSFYQPYQGIMVERCGRNLITEENISATANTTKYTALTSLYLKTGTYTLSWTVGTSVTGSRNRPYYNNGTNIYGEDTFTAGRHSWTFTLESDGTVAINWWYQSLSADTTVTDFMLEYGSTAHEFEPYTSASYPYTLGQSVYGGTVDLATGVLTVTHKYVEYDGSNDEAWEKYNGGSAGAYAMRVSEADILQSLSVTVCMANYLQSVTGGDTWGNYNAFVSGSNSPYVYTGINTITTLEAWKTHLASNPLTVVYELATPTTVQLTPTEVKTLLGYNNISSTGTVDVIYHADTKLYVDKMTAVDNNIIAPTEADFVATRNYTVNDLVIVNDMLYKVTANIATGSAITPNSNVTATTLGALIKALS